MSDKLETIYDIIAEMCGGPIPQHRHDRVLLRHYADRIEAAYKREMGNAQKMREALEKVKAIINIVPLPFELDCRLDPQEVEEAVGIIDKALSATKQEGGNSEQ